MIAGVSVTYLISKLMNNHLALAQRANEAFLNYQGNESSFSVQYTCSSVYTRQ